MKKSKKIILQQVLWLWLLLLLLAQSSAAYSNKSWLDSAKKYLYVREKPKNSNRAKEIDLWNKFVGNALGSSYCGAFAGYMKYAGNCSWDYKSGLAQNYWKHSPKNKRHSVREVIDGMYKPKAGDLIIWGKGETIFGHIGFVLHDWKGLSGWTIEANTSSGNAGSQANGDGVYPRWRTIDLNLYFHIIGFVELV